MMKGPRCILLIRGDIMPKFIDLSRGSRKIKDFTNIIKQPNKKRGNRLRFIEEGGRKIWNSAS